MLIVFVVHTEGGTWHYCSQPVSSFYLSFLLYVSFIRSQPFFCRLHPKNALSTRIRPMHDRLIASTHAYSTSLLLHAGYEQIVSDSCPVDPCLLLSVVAIHSIARGSGGVGASKADRAW